MMNPSNGRGMLGIITGMEYPIETSPDDIREGDLSTGIPGDVS
jgi:hypothetical protein